MPAPTDAMSTSVRYDHLAHWRHGGSARPSLRESRPPFPYDSETIFSRFA